MEHNNILITTTSSVENATIEQYVDLVSANIVIGTNFFSDFGASFTDLFGGFSDTYQNKLQQIYNVAIEEIKQKAINVGANAVLGFKLDFDEIAGKGKSMFMISAIGTAVRISYNDKLGGSVNPERSITNISADDLLNEISKREITQLVKSGKYLNKDQWQYLQSNPINEILPLLLSKYLKDWNEEYVSTYESEVLLQKQLPRYFKLVSSDVATDALYAEIIANTKPIVGIIESNRLFAPEKIITLIKGGHLSEASLCLLADKQSYSKEDLTQMAEIKELFINLPDIGELKMIKGGMMSKEKEKYICPEGHANENTEKLCCSCGLNIKGLTSKDIVHINKFIKKVASLEALLNPSEK